MFWIRRHIWIACFCSLLPLISGVPGPKEANERFEAATTLANCALKSFATQIGAVRSHLEEMARIDQTAILSQFKFTKVSAIVSHVNGFTLEKYHNGERRAEFVKKLDENTDVLKKKLQTLESSMEGLKTPHTLKGNPGPKWIQNNFSAKIARIKANVEKFPAHFLDCLSNDEHTKQLSSSNLFTIALEGIGLEIQEVVDQLLKVAQKEDDEEEHDSLLDSWRLIRGILVEVKDGPISLAKSKDSTGWDKSLSAAITNTTFVLKGVAKADTGVPPNLIKKCEPIVKAAKENGYIVENVLKGIVQSMEDLKKAFDHFGPKPESKVQLEE
ncbi:hypothetical protein DdX_10473 [Ditylenchus destructor]|uniref:Uncharacterized protein n=1 Tax=Ditylenchus destructor TaxID=166010 RepID=A0AAD4MYZ5_9BILA|nr:hypothetical protein DdX_10473 [Ditylenchus destructor]